MQVHSDHNIQEAIVVQQKRCFQEYLRLYSKSEFRLFSKDESICFNVHVALTMIKRHALQYNNRVWVLYTEGNTFSLLTSSPASGTLVCLFGIVSSATYIVYYNIVLRGKTAQNKHTRLNCTYLLIAIVCLALLVYRGPKMKLNLSCREREMQFNGSASRCLVDF